MKEAVTHFQCAAGAYTYLDVSTLVINGCSTRAGILTCTLYVNAYHIVGAFNNITIDLADTSLYNVGHVCATVYTRVVHVHTHSYQQNFISTPCYVFEFCNVMLYTYMYVIVTLKIREKC